MFNSIAHQGYTGYMTKTPESDGFLHDHGKEIAIGSVAALGALGLIFTIARQRLSEQAKAVAETPEEPSDNL